MKQEFHSQVRGGKEKDTGVPFLRLGTNMDTEGKTGEGHTDLLNNNKQHERRSQRGINV